MREGHLITTWEEAQAEMLRECRWPSVLVDSRQFGQLPHHERLHQLAFGYLRSAKLLCNELGENPDGLDWPRASVVAFSCYHAVELFLKACILRRSPSEQLGHHAVSRLKQKYHEFFPLDKFFGFQTPWDFSLEDVEEQFGPGAVICEAFEHKQDQVFRYLADKQGRSPKGVWCFAHGTWLDMIERFEGDFDRIWGNISEMISGVSSGEAS